MSAVKSPKPTDLCLCACGVCELGVREQNTNSLTGTAEPTLQQKQELCCMEVLGEKCFLCLVRAHTSSLVSYSLKNCEIKYTEND